MNWTAIIIILSIAVAYGDFIRNPEKYGDIMHRFDEARFQTDPSVCEMPL